MNEQRDTLPELMVILVSFEETSHGICVRLMFDVFVDSQDFQTCISETFVFLYSRAGRSRNYTTLTKLPPHLGAATS
jgi:hypothetical protein